MLLTGGGITTMERIRQQVPDLKALFVPPSLEGAVAGMTSSGPVIAQTLFNFTGGEQPAAVINGGQWGLDFDGSDVLPGACDESTNPIGDFSIAWWMKRTGVDTGVHVVAARWGTPDAWILTTTGTGGIAFAINGAGNAFAEASGRWAFDTWVHLCITYDGTDCELWVNGTGVAGQANGLGSIITSSVPFEMGAEAGASFFEGEIMHLATAYKALVFDEINSLYALKP